MSQLRSQTGSLFQTSLRDWKAQWKARQAAQPQAAETTDQPNSRVKKLVAHKRRKMKQLAAQSHG